VPIPHDKIQKWINRVPGDHITIQTRLFFDPEVFCSPCGESVPADSEWNVIMAFIVRHSGCHRQRVTVPEACPEQGVLF